MTRVVSSLVDRLSLLRMGQTERPTHLQMSRNDLPSLCHGLGLRRGAEIGVWKGAYSARFAALGIHMLCVDPWQSYPAWLDTKNALPVEDAKRAMDEAYGLAQKRLTPLPCTILRMFSVEAAAFVPDRSLDFVFIDGNHGYDAVTEDLTLWSPKVRAGGWIGGHDYRHFTNKPTIHVIEAVDAYTAAHGIDPWFVLMGDRTPSFLWMVA